MKGHGLLIKDEIVYLANNIYEEALRANTYWELLKQYHTNVDKYNDEMNYSPAFYNVIYTALVEGLFLNLSKIYDTHENSLTIKTLLGNLETITINDLDKDVKAKYDLCNQKFQHRLVLNEECFFKEKVSEQKQICELLNIEYTHTIVELNLKQLHELYVKRFNSLNRIRNKLIVQRNKIYVHNDRNTNFNFEDIYRNQPINHEETGNLIDFALDFSRYCIESLTGISKPETYVNMNDWEATLMLVSIGHKYQTLHINELLENE